MIPGSILSLRLPLSGFTTVYTIFTQTAETLETQDFIDSLLQHFHYDLKFESLLLRQKFRESQGFRSFFNFCENYSFLGKALPPKKENGAKMVPGKVK